MIHLPEILLWTGLGVLALFYLTVSVRAVWDATKGDWFHLALILVVTAALLASAGAVMMTQRSKTQKLHEEESK